MPSRGRTVGESKTEMLEVVLPDDANPLGNILGGKVMHLIDIAGAVAAHRHSHRHVVTVSVDSLDFLRPIRVGQIILLQAQVNRAFHTSMEVGVNVYLEDYISGDRHQPRAASLPYGAEREAEKPTPAPPLLPRRAEE